MPALSKKYINFFRRLMNREIQCSPDLSWGSVLNMMPNLNLRWFISCCRLKLHIWDSTQEPLILRSKSMGTGPMNLKHLYLASYCLMTFSMSMLESHSFGVLFQDSGESGLNISVSCSSLSCLSQHFSLSHILMNLCLRFSHIVGNGNDNEMGLSGCLLFHFLASLSNSCAV